MKSQHTFLHCPDLRLRNSRASESVIHKYPDGFQALLSRVGTGYAQDAAALKRLFGVSARSIALTPEQFERAKARIRNHARQFTNQQ